MNIFKLFEGNGTGCHSKVGRQGGRQELNLQFREFDEGCFKKGTIIHEFIHAIGFFHMHTASGRDDYIEIMWNNIRPGKEHNFEKHNENVVTQFGIPYDYRSVMHYSSKAFSVNGMKTLIPLTKNTKIGQRSKLSNHDVARIRAMYDCDV